MKIRTIAFVSHIFLFACLASTVRSDDWRVWRGPNANGVASSDGPYPVNWNDNQNVIWKTPVPGRGHSSPIVVGDRIFLTTADENAQTQALLCYQRSNGKPLWQVELNRGGFNPKIHNKNTHATPTPCSDGERVFVAFNNHQGVQLAAVSVDGEKIWQKAAGTYRPKTYQFGYAPSPLIYGSTVIVSSEFESDGFLAAFDRRTGQEIWRTKRPPTISYSTPIVATVANREQLLLSGCEKVSSFDPKTGRPLWAVPGMWTVTCATMVWDGDLVFASGGYPNKGTMAVRADGSGQVVWQNRVKCYEQSMLVHQGHLYGVDDAGVAYCWRSSDGTERWKKRLGGNFSASPVLADGKIYATNERGSTFVYQADPRQFVPVAQNQIGGEGFATPAFCDGRIYARSATRDSGSRQEFLICIGQR